jgi:4-diphosphocytidyl-2-C-methyl-D-erythritol kinase
VANKQKSQFAYLLIFIFPSLLFFPNCKINIGLQVVGRRSDGYHDLETVFYPVYKLYDALEVLPREAVEASPASMEPLVQLQVTGLSIQGKEEDNLCLKAYYLLKKDFPELPPIHLCLHKAIPMGAGLGGGSADGAFTLLLLNRKFHLNLTTSQLLDYALHLGSDCPFFIINKPAFAWGRGEMLETIPLNLTGYGLVLVHPGIHISTAQAFAGIKPQPPTNSLTDLVAQPVESWKEVISNSFEETVFPNHPVLPQIKAKLYGTGAVYAAMSGSGSALYGIYPLGQMPAEKLFPGYFEQHCLL